MRIAVIGDGIVGQYAISLLKNISDDVVVYHISSNKKISGNSLYFSKLNSVVPSKIFDFFGKGGTKYWHGVTPLLHPWVLDKEKDCWFDCLKNIYGFNFSNESNLSNSFYIPLFPPRSVKSFYRKKNNLIKISRSVKNITVNSNKSSSLSFECGDKLEVDFIFVACGSIGNSIIFSASNLAKVNSKIGDHLCSYVGISENTSKYLINRVKISGGHLKKCINTCNDYIVTPRAGVRDFYKIEKASLLKSIYLGNIFFNFIKKFNLGLLNDVVFNKLGISILTKLGFKTRIHGFIQHEVKDALIFSQKKMTISINTDSLKSFEDNIYSSPQKLSWNRSMGVMPGIHFFNVYSLDRRFVQPVSRYDHMPLDDIRIFDLSMGSWDSIGGWHNTTYLVHVTSLLISNFLIKFSAK